MIVTAMLCWFDEPPELLRQAIKGAAVLADRVVAADGAYELVEDKAPKSPFEQKRAIIEACAEHDLRLMFLPPRIYAGQVEKRSVVIAEAAKGSDWVFPLDADWLITGDREAIRAELRELHANGYQQVAVDFLQPDNPEREPSEKFANIWHEQQTGQFQQLPLIYRSMPVMRYQWQHWAIYSEDADGYPIGMWGGVALPRCGQAKTAWLQSEHLFEHLSLFRERKQIERNRYYIEKRDLEVARVGHET